MPERAFYFFLVFFCDIILSTMRVNKYLFSLILSIAMVPAFAGWQNAGYYVDDGYYTDDGSRFVIGLRGGVSFANAKMKNDMEKDGESRE